MSNSGDHSPTLRELLVRELPTVLPFVRSHLGPELRCRESAADLLQSVCGDLLVEGVPFEYLDVDKFRSWLCAVVVNKVRMRLRMLHTQKRGGHLGLIPLSADMELPGGGDNPLDHATVQEDLRRMEVALATLPPHYRDAIVYTRLLGCSRAEAARLMGRTEDSLRNLLPRALTALSRLMDQGPG